MGHDTFQVGELTAVIGDNAADKELGQRAGYNGIWSLLHSKSDRSFFVPGIAGLNFEHIISGEGEADKDRFFEPRRSDMSFRRISDSAAELHQPPTDTFFLRAGLASSLLLLITSTWSSGVLPVSTFLTRDTLDCSGRVI